MKLVVRPESDSDVAGQWHYIAERNLLAADRYLSAVSRTYEAIRQQPGTGNPESFRRQKGIRSWRVDGFPRYLVFYREFPDHVEVLRVLHGMRNLPRFFR